MTGFLYPGDFLGLAYGSEYAHSAEAINEVRLCRFPRTKLEVFFEEFPHLEKRLLQIASNELVEAQDQMVLLGRKSATEKIASFLMSLSIKAEQHGQIGTKLHLPMNRGDISDYLGLAVETTSRILNILARDGVVDIPTARDIELHDRERLAEIAEGETAPIPPQ